MTITNCESSQNKTEWYKDIEAGVKQILIPENTFEWLVLDLHSSDTVLSKYIKNFELRSIITDSYSECGRFRIDKNVIYRIEFPYELKKDGKDLQFVLILSTHQLIVCYAGVEPLLESSIQEIASYSHVTSPIIAACEILDDTLDLLREPLMKINKEIDSLEESILDSKPSKSLDTPIILRQKLLTIDRHLDALEALLQRSLLDRSNRDSKDDLAGIREVTDRTAWLNQRVSNQLDRIRGVSDQLRMIAMDELNISMFRLSIIATVFLPLSFITGLLGINVGGIPGATNSAAFWIVCSSLSALAVITFIFLIKALRKR